MLIAFILCIAINFCTAQQLGFKCEDGTFISASVWVENNQDSSEFLCPWPTFVCQTKFQYYSNNRQTSVTINCCNPDGTLVYNKESARLISKCAGACLTSGVSEQWIYGAINKFYIDAWGFYASSNVNPNGTSGQTIVTLGNNNIIPGQCPDGMWMVGLRYSNDGSGIVSGHLMCNGYCNKIQANTSRLVDTPWAPMLWSALNNWGCDYYCYTSPARAPTNCKFLTKINNQAAYQCDNAYVWFNGWSWVGNSDFASFGTSSKLFGPTFFKGSDFTDGYHPIALLLFGQQYQQSWWPLMKDLSWQIGCPANSYSKKVPKYYMGWHGVVICEPCYLGNCASCTACPPGAYNEGCNLTYAGICQSCTNVV